MNFMIVDIKCYDGLPLGIDTSLSIVGHEAEFSMSQASSDDVSDAASIGDNSKAPSAPKAAIVILGRDASGKSVCATLHNYMPWLRVMLVGDDSESARGKAVSDLRAHCMRILHTEDYESIVIEREMLPKFYGFEAATGPTGPTGRPEGPLAEPNARERFCCKIHVHSFKDASRLEWHLQRFSDKWEPTDTTTPKETRFYNEKGLTPSSWIHVEQFHPSAHRISTCDMHITCLENFVKAKDTETSIAPLKIMSFDAEMYSHDNGFPDVLCGDFAVAICASIMVYGTKGIVRHAFIVASEDSDIKTSTLMTVHYAKDPCDLLEQFRDLVVSEDPDLLTGWNIYGFDMPFLWDSYASAHEGPKSRGSEWLRSQFMSIVNKPFQTTGDLLKLSSKGRKQDTETRTAINALPLRYKTELRNPELLPEIVAAPIRAGLRRSLGLEPEALFGGPHDLQALRTFAETHPESRESIIFKSLIDVPKRVSGLKRGFYMGRMAIEKGILQEKRMASSAKGDNTYYIWSGRSCVDLMQIIKDDKKLDDNTLKYAAQTFLDPEFGKLDMTPAEMFKAYRTRDIQGLTSMLDYCARDADIPLLLILKLNYLPIWIEMSRVTYTPVHQVLNGGQQRKVYNLLAAFVHNTHAINKCESEWPISSYVSDSDSYDEMDSMEDALVKRKPDYQGATVIEPKTGFYTTSVSTLDFESLYPSIMIHFNLCPSVYVVPSTAPLKSPDIIVESHVIKHSILESSDTYRDFEASYGFVKNVQGVVPKLLQHLLAARKVAKKAMANATNEFDKSVQNGRQLALKVSCNSVYGFFGVTPGRGLMSCKPVAAVTTLKGRAFIEAAKNYVESHYSGSEVIYGDTDSIMINWGQLPDVPRAYRLAEEASAAITEMLRNGTVEGATKPMLKSAVSAVTLANEKVYKPYLLIQKKNYAGFKYLLKGRHEPNTLDDFETSVDMKGIDAVRRDRSKLIKTLSGSLLDALLIEGSLTKAIEQLKETLETVASQKAPLDWFVLSKSLKSRYKTDNQPHVQARKRMISRGDQDVPEIGTRMPYVIVRPKGTKTTGPLYLRTEHPDFVATNKIPYCAKYYLENAQDVIIRLLRPTGKEALVTKIFSDAIASADHLASGNMSLMSFFSKRQKTI